MRATCRVALALALLPGLTARADEPAAIGVAPCADARPEALRAAAIAACARGAYTEAVALLEEEVRARRPARDPRALREALGELGLLQDRLASYEGACACWQEALEISERLRDEGSAGSALAHLGGIRLAMGDYAEALRLHERALERCERAGESARAAAVLANLGVIHQRLGAFERALACQERALAKFEAAGDRARVAAAVGNLGGIYWSLGETERAGQYLERARRLSMELGDRAGVAEALSNLGLLHGSTGSLDLAQVCHEGSLAIRRELGDRAGVATALGFLGLLHVDLGRTEEALSLQRQALAEAEVLGDQELQVRSLWGMAATRLLAGEPTEAIASARRAVALLPALVRGLSDAEGAASRQARAGLFEVGARAAVVLGDAEALYFFLESGRAGALLEALGGRERLLALVLPERLRQAERSARAREARALACYRLALDGGERAAIRARRAEFEGARDAVRETIERIQREAKGAADLVFPRAAALETVQGSLEDDEALLELAVLGRQAVGLVLTAESARIVPLGSAEALRTLQADLAADSPTGEPAEPLAALRRLLVEPLGLAPHVRRLLVATDARLVNVPFTLLVGEREVVSIPSATTWRLLLSERDRMGTGVLALGDPDYEQDGPGANTLARMASGVGFAPLPDSRAEARAVGDVVLLGAEATEAGLRFALSRRARWRAVHLACHGLADLECPLRSTLALTPDGEDDGFLTAQEVFLLRIPADLVVLSACCAGRGVEERAEGIPALVRAVLFAGAPRVVVSAWNGDDRATRALMTELHARWKAGAGTGEALRAAQAAVRATPGWEHPYYWAGWNLWGLAD